MTEALPETPEERMLQAALDLGRWESEAIRRIGASASLSFDRHSKEPDQLLGTILRCAKEIQQARLESEKSETENTKL